MALPRLWRPLAAAPGLRWAPRRPPLLRQRCRLPPARRRQASHHRRPQPRRQQRGRRCRQPRRCHEQRRQQRQPPRQLQRRPPLWRPRRRRLPQRRPRHPVCAGRCRRNAASAAWHPAPGAARALSKPCNTLAIRPLIASHPRTARRKQSRAQCALEAQIASAARAPSSAPSCGCPRAP